MDYGRIVATVIRVRGGDFAAAEEVLQEAFADALAQWPAQGAPQEPRAWLVRAARNRGVDRGWPRRQLRRSSRAARGQPPL